MSETTSSDLAEVPVTVPVLTRGWRMQMALDHGGRSVEYMAMKLGVSRSTVSRWINDGGKRPPRRGDMEIWARECRVPLQWLAPAEGEPEVVQPTEKRLTTKLRAIQGEGRDSTPRLPMLTPVNCP